jgi:DNA-binding MarR family transcriptional regulator
MARQEHLDDFLPYLMNRLVARMNQNLGEQLRKHGHTFQDWRILAVLAVHDHVNLTELAEATVIPQPTVSRLVASLARKGFIARRNGARDSRFRQVSITPRGRDVYARMRVAALAEYRAALKGFSGTESEALRESLLRMMKNRNVRLLTK